MISEVRKEETISRLVVWGCAVAGGLSDYARISRMVRVSCSDGYSSSIPICPEVELTERAVCALTTDLRAVLKEHYTVLDATLEQRLKALGVSKSTYYRLHDQAVIRTAENIRDLQRQLGTRKHKENYKMQQNRL